jgi:phage host-nuclease inhibitor protein Gam
MSKSRVKTSGAPGQAREKAAQAMQSLRTRLAAIEKLDRDAAAEIAAHEAQIAALRETAAAKRAPLVEEAATLSETIYEYAEEHRLEFTGAPEGKTGLFDAGGLVRWHHFQPKVIIDDEEKLVKFLKSHRLVGKFGKTIIEPSKTKILAKREEAKKLPGVTLKPGRTFKVLAPEVILQAHKDLEDPRATWEFVYPNPKSVSA